MQSRTRRKKVPVSSYETENGVLMSEVRCVNSDCKTFLLYEAIEIGIIQCKCNRCKKVTQFSKVPGDDTAPDKMRQVRCGQCGRILYDEAIIAGAVKIKCRVCGRWNTLKITDSQLDSSNGNAIINAKVEKPIEPV